MSRWSSPLTHAGRYRALRLEPLETRNLLSASSAVSLLLPPQTRLHDLEAGVLTGPSNDDPALIAEKYLASQAGALGLVANDLAGLLLTNRYTDSQSGTTHLYYTQTYLGWRVANTTLNVNISRLGEVINVGSAFVPEIASAASFNAEDKRLNESGAVAALADALRIDAGEIAARGPSTLSDWGVTTTMVAPPVSLDDIPVTTIWALASDGSVRPAYDLVARATTGGNWYNVGIDWQTGSVLYIVDWSSGVVDENFQSVADDSASGPVVATSGSSSFASASLVDGAQYMVYPRPVEAPNDGGRSLVVDPADPLASPFGWHDTNGVAGAEFQDTRGNNVWAQEDVDFNNQGGARPSGGASLVFNFPIDLTQAPSTYLNAATTNLFYWNNLLHDIHYRYGFTELAGNFQTNNYGRGGLGNDHVFADAQDGSGTNNANFATPPDGSSPRMQQFIFTITTPNRDSSLDNQIIIHEYGHGVSTRLTGGPANSNSLSALQSSAMGEGWSDWWSLMLTQKESDTKLAGYGVGTYVLGQAPTGPGIRNFRYSFDMSINPLTYASYNLSQQEHRAGEIWCSALWDMNWLLIDKYGFQANLEGGYAGSESGGNVLALQLVMNALKLQPANPTYLDGRDALLLADQQLTGGQNKVEIWTAFARRGMGLSAHDGGSANATSVTEAFDLPIFNLSVTTTTPALNTILSIAPTSFVVNFSDPYQTASVDASDLRVNGIPATSVQLTDADTLTFQFATSPVTVQGLQTLTLDAGVLLRASDGDPLLPFLGNFRYDVTPLVAASTTPAQGAVVALPLTTLVIGFNEPIDFASVSSGDLTVSQGQVTGLVSVNASTVRFVLANVVDEGNFTFSIPAGAVNDAFGNPGQAVAGSFSLDGGTVPFPPLQPVLPVGASIYQAGLNGTIFPAGDIDSFTIAIEAGQTLSAFFQPMTTSFRPTITLRSPQGVVLTSHTAASNGAGALFGPVALVTSGIYTIELSGAQGTTGSGNLQVFLNAALEAASFLKLATPTLQSLDSSAVVAGVQADRMAALGELPATMSSPVTQAATDVPKPLPDLATVDSSIVINAAGTVADIDVQINLNHTYNGDLRISLISPNGTSVILSNRRGGSGNNYLDTIFDDEAVVPIIAGFPPFTGRFRPDEVLSRFDGESITGTWTLRIQDLAGLDEGTLNSWSLTYQVAVPPPQDVYTVVLQSGEPLAAVLDGDSQFILELRDPADQLLVTGSSAGGYTSTLSYAAPAAGTYRLVVRSTGPSGNYRLWASRGAAIELESNNSLATPQSINPARSVLGHLAFNDDVYSFSLNVGESVVLTTSTPGDGVGEPANSLDPRIELFNAIGQLLGSDDNSALDGRNARLSFTAPTTGTYRVRVSAVNGTQGEYAFQVKPASFGGAPIVPAVQTLEDTISDLIFVQPAIAVPLTTSFFLVGNITGGTLWLSDGVTPVVAGSYLARSTTQAGLRFFPSPNATASGNFHIQAASFASSAGLFGGVATVTVNVVAVNDPPRIVVPGTQLVPLNQTINLLGLGVSDIDATHGELNLSALLGSFQLNLAGFVGITAGDVVGQGTSSVTITAPLDALNSLFASVGRLVYQAPLNTLGTDLLTITINDLGQTGLGGPLVDQGTVSVLIHDPLGNDAPWLDPTKHPRLDDVLQGDSDPAGTLISALFNSPSGIGTLFDPDDGAQQGIAIVGVNPAAGTWEYSLNNGATWLPIGTPSVTEALLLAADSQTRLRLRPNSTFWGPVNQAVRIRGWDQTSGANGDRVDTSIHGGSTAFSSNTTTLEQWVTSSNFELDGSTLSIIGSPGNDTFSFVVLGGGLFAVRLNGQQQIISAALANQFRFNGGSGNDVVYFIGDPTAAEHGLFGPGTLVYTGAGYGFEVISASTIVAYGDSSDSQTFTGSDANDIYYGFPAAAIFTSDERVTTTVGFGQTSILASGGRDAAVLFDTPGDDLFVGLPQRSTFTGPGLDITLDGFHLVYVFSTGGDDDADLHGSTGNDVFYGLDVYSVLADSQLSQFFYQAIGFSRVRGYDALNEPVTGFDIAVFYDSNADDFLQISAQRTVQSSAHYSTEINGFDFVYALASEQGGGIDTVEFIDSPGNDHLVAESFGQFPNRLDLLTFFTGGIVVQVVNYDQVMARSTTGHDTVARQSLAVDYALALDARWIQV